MQSLIPKKKIEHYTYVMTEPIGKGYSSKVYKGKDENSGETVAVKVIDMKSITNEVEKALITQEINALKLIQSINVIKLLDHYVTNNNTYIITEFCNQGDLGNLIKQFGQINEPDAIKILKHIINGFKDQIKKGVIHRDLKPSNILIKNGVPKIADYGFSKMQRAPKEKVYYRVGTPIYMSPESFLESKYSEKSDIWSIGVLYYEMIYGQCPWVITNEAEFEASVSQLHFPRNVPVSEESKDFLRKVLTFDENARLSLQDLEVHPLFNRRNTTTLTKPRSALASNSFNKSITQLNLVKVNQTQNPIRSGSTNKPLTSPDRKDGHKPQKSIQLTTKVVEKISTVIQHSYSSFHYGNFIIKTGESLCEEIIMNKLNYCKFLFRTSQICEHVKGFQNYKKERLISMMGRDCIEHMLKIKDIYEKGVNHYKINNFNQNQVIAAMNRVQFKDQYQKMRDFFMKFPDTQEILLKDVIRELNHNIRLMEFSEPSVLLLDYLVFYYQILDSKIICQIIDGRPANEITQAHYQEIRLKIFNLGI